MNCVGVFDVLTFDNSQNNHLALMPQYQVLAAVIKCSLIGVEFHIWRNRESDVCFLHACALICALLVCLCAASRPCVTGQGGAGAGM